MVIELLSQDIFLPPLKIVKAAWDMDRDILGFAYITK
jgi:hypothetical protein